jgi:Zn-dependent metalloprotease
MAKGMRSAVLHRDQLGGATLSAAIGSSVEMASPAALKEMDPERAARRILNSLVGAAGAEGIASSVSGGPVAEFKSLGVDKIAFTGTQTVKFRQHVNKIPVYGSLVTVELDHENNFMAVNSSLGEPGGVDPNATLSPAQAVQLVRKSAGYGDRPLESAARPYFYFDQSSNRWRLVYIVEDVLRYTPRKSKEADPLTALPEFSDFVIDAHSGELVDELPRTQTMAEVDEQQDASDSLNIARHLQFLKDNVANAAKLHDRQRNVHTHDFGFRDTLFEAAQLPGPYAENPPDPWDPGAVSAHANASEVADFLKQVLGRDGLDGNGGRIVSSVNCLRFGQSSGKEWRNAARIPGQMIYGQRNVAGKLRSYAAALDVVAHELLHGLTDNTARLEYRFQSGALNESYSDIFGIIVSNIGESDIGSWNWEMGEALNETGVPIRDMRDPTRVNQPAHMDDYREMPLDNDEGGVHTNSGIHNKAAYNILTAKASNGKFLFSAVDVARLFYKALLSQLSRNSEFVDSRKGVVLAAKTQFLTDAQRAEKIAAIERAFDEVGIVEPSIA